MINQPHNLFVLNQEAKRFILGDWYIDGIIIIQTPCMAYLWNPLCIVYTVAFIGDI